MQLTHSNGMGKTMNQADAMNEKTWENPIGLDGMEFMEYASPEPEKLETLFQSMGFQKVGQHKTMDVVLYRQNDVNFILNREKSSFAESFQKAHGPSICATGFRVKDAKKAYEEAVRRGARPHENPEMHTFPAIYGIGDSVVYFIDQYGTADIYKGDFDLEESPDNKGYGFLRVDHMTNNVPKGEMDQWCQFYEDVFNFKDVRFFDIRGEKTGLVSKVMKSPCGKIIIPINEPTDTKSQIQEYLDEYGGSGIQHIALLTADMIESVQKLREGGMRFLETPDTYYELLPKRLPDITEDIDVLHKLGILADGDEEGYLLQIFTQNAIGPIFFEIIQRKNHDGFGEGNFQALFDSIELDQRRRGYLD